MGHFFCIRCSRVLNRRNGAWIFLRWDKFGVSVSLAGHFNIDRNFGINSLDTGRIVVNWPGKSKCLESFFGNNLYHLRRSCSFLFTKFHTGDLKLFARHVSSIGCGFLDLS